MRVAQTRILQVARVWLFASMMAYAPWAQAQVVLPGSADGARVNPAPTQMPVPTGVEPGKEPVKIIQTPRVPEGAKSIRFVLKEVVLQGESPKAEISLRDIYAPYIGREITLDMAWVFAGMITERYRSAGYFLSQAYVPAQSIDGGQLKLVLIEGYIHEVTTEGEGVDEPLVKEWIARLQSYRPLSSKVLESALLRLNDLPGVSFRAVLEPVRSKNAPEGATGLHLVGAREEPSASLRADNHGSRYLGPYQLGAQASASVLPMHNTSVSGLVSSPMDELKSYSLRHEMALDIGLTVEAFVTRTNAQPGYNLRVQNIKSRSDTLGVVGKYSLIRQRDENLSARLAAEVRETDSEIFGTTLTKDHIRMIRTGMNYDVADRYQGYSSAGFELTQGIGAFGSSDAGDRNLSRGEAEPDFTKLTFNLSRLQALMDDVVLLTSAEGQVASGPLYSSEEFGYGGQAFGRAYDSSELTGDHGLSGALEVRYTGLSLREDITTVPFAFYDAGIAWNEDIAQDKQVSASSVGFGLRMQSDLGVGGSFGVAFPLTKSVNDPLYTQNGSNPRYMMELNYGF